ncbi:MAG: cyclodeaminase/cyclohydrolase family protein [Acidaminococcaceae bacterium]|nr:cyclodeaminase/cyclohydrolase family protein [Acidaminococcaceae bacterium]
MEMDFAKHSIESFVQDLNSTKPMPGGGSAAAICGAMAAALAGMSAHMTAGKKKYEAVEEKMQEIITATKILQEEMLAMAREDADMYSLVLQAYKLPKATEEEAAQRAKAIEGASKTAVVASLKVTGACIRIMKLAYTTVTEGNQMMVTDGSASALLARACQQVAAYNVRINLGGVKDKTVVAEAERLLKSHLAEGDRLLEDVLREVEARL